MISLIFSIIVNGLSLGRKEIILIFFLIMLSTLIELVGISLIIPLITIFLDPVNVILYQNLPIFKFLYNFDSEHFFSFILIIFFLIFLLKYILVILTEYKVVQYSKRLEISLIIRLIDYHLSRPWIDTIKNENLLIKNILTDIPAFTNTGLIVVLNVFKNLLILLGIITYLTYSIGTLVIEMFLIGCLILYFFFNFFKNFITKVSSNFSNYMDVKYNLNGEISKGLREIKIHNLKLFFLKEYSNNENLIAKTDILKKIVSILPKIIIELLFILIFLLIAFFNKENSQNLLPLLGLLSFIIYRSQPLLSSLASSLATLQLFYYQIKNAILIIDQSKNFINLKQIIELKKIDSNSVSTIEIKNLGFSYEDNFNKEIFLNLNLHFKFGKIYGFKGENGSGKSTLADLITGLLKPQKGEILLNGKNINLYGDSWMNFVSYLSQNFFLFNDTIKNNITLNSKSSNSLIEEEYKRALKISNLFDEIKKFNDKDDTLLLSSGSNLSGGQKQKIAIARLIYRNSKIVVLDEPTSSLDDKSSNLMMNMLKEIKQDKLIIVISHSQEILNQCDEIYNLNNYSINSNK